MGNLRDDLAAVVVHRSHLEAEERRLIEDALAHGWSFSEVGRALGVTRQAVAKRYTNSTARRPKAPTRVQRILAQQHKEREFTELIESVLGPRESRSWPKPVREKPPRRSPSQD
jgi:IS30 family transposase